MSTLSRFALPLIAVALLLPASGCAKNKLKGDTEYVARDVNTLYSLAKKKRQACSLPR